MGLAKPQAVGETLFVALEPDAALAAMVGNYKRRVRELVGPQLFLDDPPHLTVYLAVFASVPLITEHFAELAARLAGFEFDITGWHVFVADPLTGNYTLVCEIAAHDKHRLRGVQHEVIAAIAPLSDSAATQARLAGRLAQLSPERRAEIDRVGFPFVGEDWHPHWTIASIGEKDWPAVWSALKDDPPSGRFGWTRLRLYRLEGERPVAVTE